MIILPTHLPPSWLSQKHPTFGSVSKNPIQDTDLAFAAASSVAGPAAVEVAALIRSWTTEVETSQNVVTGRFSKMVPSGKRT